MSNSGRGLGIRGPSLIFSKEPIKHGPKKVETMKIKLTRDYQVCRDGIRPEQFRAGDEVEMPAPIAAVLLEDGRAVEPEQVKINPGAPENKMEKGAPATKRGKGA
jgi:hypothetical protein